MRQSTLRDYFEQIYVINLPDRIDRRKQIAHELTNIGIDISSDVEVFSAIRPADPLAFPTIGTLGCYQSHLAVLKHAAAVKADKILVIEDDLMISRRLPIIEANLLDRLRVAEWDMLLLGFFPYFGLSLSTYYQREIENPMFYSSVTFKGPLSLPGGAHFYALKGRVLSRLISFLEHVLEVRSCRVLVDNRMSNFHMDIAYLDTALYIFSIDNPDIAYRIACPILGWQRYTRSDVQSTDRRYPAWFDSWRNCVKTDVWNMLDYYWPAILASQIAERRHFWRHHTRAKEFHRNFLVFNTLCGAVGELHPSRRDRPGKERHTGSGHASIMPMS